MLNDYKNFEFELIRYFSMSSPVNQKMSSINMNPQEDIASGIVYKSALRTLSRENDSKC